jgi:hypothetical protein
MIHIEQYHHTVLSGCKLNFNPFSLLVAGYCRNGFKAFLQTFFRLGMLDLGNKLKVPVFGY